MCLENFGATLLIYTFTLTLVEKNQNSLSVCHEIGGSVLLFRDLKSLRTTALNTLYSHTKENNKLIFFIFLLFIQTINVFSYTTKNISIDFFNSD